MNSKDKSNISESRTLYEFAKRDIPVCVPWGDNERYDLVAEFNGKFNRIQVKTCNEEENGGVRCYCRSSTNHTTNKNYTTYVGEIDYFVFYNQVHDLIALVPIQDIGDKKQIVLRYLPTANGQSKGVKFFSDYTFDKILFNTSSA